MKRLCLFAGYNENGLVEDYVIHYVKALSAYCDVFYLADNECSETELRKLEPFTHGRWASPHGRYDFGSWQKLIFILGWARLASYDSVLLVNDSNYGPTFDISRVFTKMEDRPVQFWGITHNNGVFPHLQSYFISLHRQAIASNALRNFFETISVCQTKEEVCIKYEIGLTKMLRLDGFSFDTYIDRETLPIDFGADISQFQNTLLSAGSPFIKKKIFSKKGFALEDLSETRELLIRSNYSLSLIRWNEEVFRQNEVSSEGSRSFTTSLPARRRTLGQGPRIFNACKQAWRKLRHDHYRSLEKNLQSLEKTLQSYEWLARMSDTRVIESFDVQAQRIASLSNRVSDQIALAHRLHDKVDAQADRLDEVLRALADQRVSIDEVHLHIDWTQRDMLVAIKNRIDFGREAGFTCLTDYPVAYDSPDHFHPVGTIIDHSRHPRFVRACEDHFGKKEGLSFLDVGCSSGGIVWDAILRGHVGVGLEGSDLSKLQQRAEWRLLAESLFTCDISRPFQLLRYGVGPYAFDVVSAWEVLEHLTKDGVQGLFNNLAAHTRAGSLFACSISQVDGGFTEDGAPLHQTLEPLSWWVEAAALHGFRPLQNAFAELDFARGNGNPCIYYRPQHSYKERAGDCLLVLFERE